MKRIEDNELKAIQIKILNVVSSFCEKNNIKYWLDSGTLLGAVRHKGYIPWDDDIDVGMLRADYDNFMRTFNASNERYKFYSIENNKRFYYPHGKVLDTETILYEPDKKGNKLSVNIDIFVYDNAPDDDAVVAKMYNRRDIYRKYSGIRLSHSKPRGSLIRRIAVYGCRFISRLLPASYYIEKIANNSKKFANKQTERVGNFTSYTRIACKKEIFNDFIDVTFEGNLYKAPIGYDEWLKAFYGDYMKLPPIEKRVSHHTFVAFIDETK